MVRDWWHRALGCHERPIVDIRAVHSQGAAYEIIKYLTKDIDASGEKVPPAVYAEVYRALDAKRLTHASKGFMGLADRKAALCDCGTPLPRPKRKPRAPESQEGAT